MRLLLESALGLHGQFGRHDCGDPPSVMDAMGFVELAVVVVVDIDEFRCS